VAGIVAIAVGGYLFLFAVVLIIRQCLLAKGKDLFPPWLSEWCTCGCCCGTQATGCLQGCAESLNCQYPNRKVILDNICPSKQWCDQTFCCCMSSEPGGKCLEDCQGPECGCGDMCNCQCQCQTPNSINCICFEINLSNS